MIHSFYEHGGDQPATGLSVAQLAGASRDAAGTLWIDLDSPTAAEREEVLVNTLALEPASPGGATDVPQGFVLGRRHARLTARVPGDAPGTGTLATLILYVAPNFVVTEHPGLALMGPLRERARSSISVGGSVEVAGGVLDAVSEACSSRLAALETRLGELEDAVTKKPGRDTGRRLYEVRRELEVFSESLPALETACHELAAASIPGMPAASDALAPASERLARQSRVARRLRRRGDLAMAAHSQELLGSLEARQEVGLVLAVLAFIVVAVFVLMMLS